jgi:hypothetical protein
MFSEQIDPKARNWMIFFFLKTNLVIFGILFLFNGFLYHSAVVLLIALPPLFIGLILVYHDIQSDPYQMLRLFKIQMILWWRLQGPLIKRKPFYYHFPEGSQLQQQHLNRTVSVTQKEMVEGVTRIITARFAQLCSECGGKRSEPMTVQIECPQCENGRQYHPLGAISIPIPCKSCLGVGWSPIKPCSRCGGDGSVWENQRIRVQIPPHTSPGTKLRIPTLGRINPKTLHQGDLFLKLRKKIFNII